MRNATSHLEACVWTDDIVGYIYGELGSDARTAFESHLLDCGECVDELAEISFSRFSVYEWQQEEFAPLATPKFAIPAAESRPLLAGVWEIFSRPMAAPAFAAAVLMLVAGMWFVQFESAPTPPLSEVAAEIVPDTSPAAAAPSPIIVEQDSEVGPLVSSSAAVPSKEPRIIAKARSKSVRAPGKAATANAPSPMTEARVAANANLRPPVLSAETDVSDNSLRLSDIFDSDGTR